MCNYKQGMERWMRYCQETFKPMPMPQLPKGEERLLLESGSGRHSELDNYSIVSIIGIVGKAGGQPTFPDRKDTETMAHDERTEVLKTELDRVLHTLCDAAETCAELVHEYNPRFKAAQKDPDPEFVHEIEDGINARLVA